MPLSRRDVIKNAVGGSLILVAGMPVSILQAQTIPDPLRRRMKLEEFMKHQDLVASLKLGVATMKSRKPSDPKSWFFQGAIHGVLPQTISEAQTADPNVSNVDQAKFWNQCPHFENLHAPSADFLIWHRAYLYYFERILREASGDDRLCLPYWNYLEKEQRTFPGIYGDPEQQTPNGPPTNPLYDARRENAFTVGVLELNPRAVNTDNAFSKTDFFGAITNEGFAGAVNATEAGEPRDQGPIERNPHNLVHFAIGGVIARDPQGDDVTSGLMADVSTAAFDPIFWVHHSNIDRLWSVWDQSDGRRWGYTPGPDWFASKPWSFYDVDGTVKNEPRSFYMQQRNLGIDFDSDIAGKARLSDKLPQTDNRIAIDLNAAIGGIAISNDTQVAAMGMASMPITVTPDKAQRLLVKITGQHPFGVATLSTALKEAPHSTLRLALLVVQGVDYTSVPSASYEIHINPGTETPSLDSKSYVGTLALFGLKHHGQHHENSTGHGSTQIFSLSAEIAEQIQETKDVEVVFIPIPLLVEKDPKAIVRPASRQPNAESVKVGGVFISGIQVRFADR